MVTSDDDDDGADWSDIARGLTFFGVAIGLGLLLSLTVDELPDVVAAPTVCAVIFIAFQVSSRIGHEKAVRAGMTPMLAAKRWKRALLVTALVIAGTWLFGESRGWREPDTLSLHASASFLLGFFGIPTEV